jgi:hypothetical protein
MYLRYTVYSWRMLVATADRPVHLVSVVPQLFPQRVLAWTILGKSTDFTGITVLYSAFRLSSISQRDSLGWDGVGWGVTDRHTALFNAVFLVCVLITSQFLASFGVTSTCTVKHNLTVHVLKLHSISFSPHTISFAHLQCFNCKVLEHYVTVCF